MGTSRWRRCNWWWTEASEWHRGWWQWAAGGGLVELEICLAVIMAANQGDMYRLNDIAHVAGFIDQELNRTRPDRTGMDRAGPKLTEPNRTESIRTRINDVLMYAYFQPTRCVRSVHRQQKMILHDRILPYLDRANLLHVAQLNDYWFKLDEPLISAFVERWRLETHTFHMPFGECAVTLQDVAYQFGLPIDGHAVSGCLSDFEQLMDGGKAAWVWFGELIGELPPDDCIDDFTVSFSWFKNKFRVLPAHASEETVQIYARGYIMMLCPLRCSRIILVPGYTYGGSRMLQTSMDSASTVGLRPPCLGCTGVSVGLQIGMPRGFDAILWPLAARWGRFLSSSDEKGPRVIATRHKLDRLTGDDFIWMPYSSLEVIQVVHPDILRPDHTLFWKSTTALIYVASIEWHQVDRILSQLGGVQHIPEPAINIDFLLSKDDLHPSAEYLDWWFRVARRFLSHDRLLMDPRAGGVPVDAPVRGHVAAPARQQGPNVPDNRRRATRERVGTRYSQPVGARHEDAIGMDEDPEHHDDDGSGGGDDGDDRGDDGGIGHQGHRGGWGHGGGGSGWGWGGGDGWGGGGGGGSGWGGGASGSGWGGGGGGSSWGGDASGSGGHVAGHQADTDVAGVEGTLFHCTTEGGSGGVQADAATLFSEFGSPNQMEQVFGAGSEFFADFAQFGSPAGDYRPQFDGVAVDLNVDLNEVPTGYQGGKFSLGGTPASALGGLRQHPLPVLPEPADAADSRPPDAFVPVTQRRKRVIKPAKCGTGSHMC
ncbi:uncharacterized protein DS421_9g276190 [Arachis hypogaea]|nr:uncharacterized protein DS421_9g276190 [Arachis hypogaea]